MSFIGNASIKFQEYEIDRARWQLSWRNELVPLTRKTFDLLLYLVDHADRVVGKDELLRTLWPESFVEESNLTQHIFLLRKALSRHDGGGRIIETVPGRGYRFAAPLTIDPPTRGDRMVITSAESMTRITLEEEVVDSPDATPELAISPVALKRPAATRRIYWISGLVAVAAALCVAGWFLWQRWLDHTGGSPVQVVLTPMEGTTGDAVLDKTLTQAFRMDLSQSPYVSLVPGSTVRATLTMMMHKPDDVMTAAMAREVCERTNSQGVLSGNVAKVGQHFLLTEEASSCVDGSVVGSAKYEADKPEDLPQGIEKIAATLRRRLGESRRSIARFDTPLVPMNTNSLEALKDYTLASQMMAQGKMPDDITLLKEAIALDPQFAAARYDLAAAYISTGDFVNGRAAALKAYEVRDQGTEPIRLAIDALYNSYLTEDLFAAERTYRTWTEMYPRSPQAWNGLSVAQRDLGHHADSAASGLRALALAPKFMGLYSNAAYEQMRAGDIQGARATLDSALAHGFDDDSIHQTYLYIAFLSHDAALEQAQLAWIGAHPNASLCRILQVGIALGEGRFVESHHLLDEDVALLRQQGLTGFADAMTKNVGTNFIEAGDEAEGSRIFRSVAVDPENGGELIGLAEAGDIKTAQTYVQAERAKYPNGTVWQKDYGPWFDAVVAFARHNPEQAITLLEGSRELEARGLDVSKFRGDLYLAAGKPGMAEGEYRFVVHHPYLDPFSAKYPLAWLGLGRALAAEGNRDGAMAAYRQFLELWKDADPDAKFLVEAKQEFAKLQPGISPK